MAQFSPVATRPPLNLEWSPAHSEAFSSHGGDALHGVSDHGGDALHGVSSHGGEATSSASHVEALNKLQHEMTELQDLQSILAPESLGESTTLPDQAEPQANFNTLQ